MSGPRSVERLSPRSARWLVSVEGREAIERASREIGDGADALTLVTGLRRAGLDHDQAAAATSAAHARGALLGRLAAAGDAEVDAPDPAGRVDQVAAQLVLTRSAEQQASHPSVARWRARRFAGAGPVVDLCCGAGLDAIALGAAAGAVIEVDLDEARVVLADHNRRAASVPGIAIVGDALRRPVATDALVHADPSRRGTRGRARRLGEYRPAVGALIDAVGRARGAGIVLSPAVAWDDPELPDDAEVEFLQLGADLMEATAWLGALRAPGVAASATLLPGGDTRRRTGRPVRLPVGAVGDWLIEVAPAAVRARLHDELGAEAGARRIARRRALLTSDERPPPSPWWSSWPVEAVLPPRARQLRTWLAERDELPVEIATDGVEVQPAAMWRELGRPPRGPRGRRIHLVRLDGGARAVICRTDG